MHMNYGSEGLKRMWKRAAGGKGVMYSQQGASAGDILFPRATNL